ncbi:MAG: cell division protein FtsA [Firmicutes bacterium]|nr:cell division protein FtsA [Bacillota bacterium]
MRKIIASLDIGESEIKLIVGEISKEKLNILACLTVASRGIKQGFVVNPESAIESLEEVFEKAQITLGIRPDKVVVTVPSNGFECFLSEGYTSITSENKIINGQDIIKAMQATVVKKIDETKELVSILPTKFVIDDTDVVENPLNHKGDKLYIKAVVVTVPRKNVRAILRCLERIKVKVVDVTLGSLGDYYQFKNKNTESLIGAIVNIGASKTNVAIFNKGILTNCEVIDMGGNHVDNDLSYVYKVNKDDALYIKETLCLADLNMALPTESVVLEDKNKEKIKINQYDSSEIVTSRLEEILNLVKKQINLLTKKQISYIIITGGVTETADFKYLVEKIFNNARIGNVKEIGARHNKYATALGLIKYYDSRLRLINKDFSIFSVEEQEELSGMNKKVNISENSILGKLFGYFFDN